MSLFYQNVLHFSNKSVNFGAESLFGFYFKFS